MLLCCLIFCTNGLFAQEWKLERDKSGVKIYTRFLEGWDLKQFRGEIMIKGTVADMEKTLRNAAARCKWMHNTVDTKDVKVVSENEVYAYCRLEAPWPVSDRDNVTKYTFKSISSREMYVYFKNESGVEPEKPGVVRINRMEGYWHFKQMLSGYVKVTQLAVAEAGGSVPAWLANSAVIDSPYNTLLNLKKYVESHVSQTVGN